MTTQLSKLSLTILLLVMLVVSSLQLQKNRIQEARPSLAPPLSSIPKPLINMLMLGHIRLYEHFVYLWLIKYLIPDEGVPLEPAPILLRKSVNALKLLPPSEPLYLLACYVQAFRYKQAEVCQEILIKGMAAIPESWKIPMTLGYIWAFLIGDQQTGGHYYAVAAEVKGAPTFLESLAKKLKSKEQIPSKDIQKSFEQIFGPNSNESPERK